MGIKELIPVLKKHFPAQVLDGVPHNCKVMIDEVMLLVFKYASIDEAADVTLLDVLKMMAAAHLRFFVEGGQLLVLTADDSRYVPKQKGNEQKKRAAAVSTSRDDYCYPSSAELEPAIVETVIKDEKTGEERREYTTTEGGVRLQKKVVDEQGNETEVQVIQFKISPRKLIATRRLRMKLVEQFFLYVKSVISQWPQNSFIVLDRKNVETITPNTFVSRPDFENTIGEGEIKAIYWYTKLSCIKGWDNLSYLAKTKDTDALAVAVLQLWERVVEKKLHCAPLAWQFAPGKYVDVLQLIRVLHSRGWTKIMFATACVLSGTDYSLKSNTTHFIGLAPMWETWCRHQERIRIAIDYRTIGVGKDDETSVLKETFEAMVKTAYGGRSGLKNPVACTWDDVAATCAKSKVMRDPSPGTSWYVVGWAECRWVLDYWLSLGEVRSDIILNRGEFNRDSTLIEEKLGLSKPKPLPPPKPLRPKIGGDSDVDDPDDDDDPTDISDLKTASGHAADLLERYMNQEEEDKPDTKSRENYETFIRKTTTDPRGFVYKNKTKRTDDSLSWVSKKKNKYTDDDCVHPTKVALFKPR